MRFLALLPAALLLACPSAPPEEEPTPPPEPVVSSRTLAHFLVPGEYPVGRTTLDLVDTTRITPATDELPERPERSLTVEVWYPAEVGGRDAPIVPGPQPIVLWAHGFMSTRLDSPALAEHLASHGYVFAAPDFPLSSRNGGDPTAADVVNQAGDLSFILDTLLADPDFDSALVGVGGISLGGLTTLLIGLDTDTRDERIDALLPLTPATCPLDPATLTTTAPLLLAHGTSDAILPYEEHALPFWGQSEGPRRFVTLDGGTHTGFVDVTEELLASSPHADGLGCQQITSELDDDVPGGDVLNPTCPAPCSDPLDSYPAPMVTTRQGELTRALALAFFDATLREDPEAALWLDAGLALQNEDVTLQVGE